MTIIEKINEQCMSLVFRVLKILNKIMFGRVQKKRGF